jgi:hypothetical protein
VRTRYTRSSADSAATTHLLQLDAGNPPCSIAKRYGYHRVAALLPGGGAVAVDLLAPDDTAAAATAAAAAATVGSGTRIAIGGTEYQWASDPSKPSIQLQRGTAGEQKAAGIRM